MTDAVHAYYKATQTAAEKREDGYRMIAERYDKDHVTFDELREEFHCGARTIRVALATYGIAIRQPCKRPGRKAATAAQEDAALIARFEGETAWVAAMLADVLPAGARVTTKSFSYLCQEIRDAKCPYCRVMIRFPHCGRRIQGETTEGSHFGANHCAEGDCDALPGPEREAAFRAYVEYRKHQWQAFAELDTKIAHARANAERAGETMLNGVRIGGA